MISGSGRVSTSRLILLPLIRKGVGIKSSGKFAKGPRKIREEEQLDNQQYLAI